MLTEREEKDKNLQKDIFLCNVYNKIFIIKKGLTNVPIPFYN